MLANFLIGLREGLEAALVVGILIAYVVKTDQRQLMRPIWLGVGAAVALSLLLGATLTFGTKTLTFEAQEAIGGALSIVAVGFVTWMVFWMAKNARDLKGHLQSSVDRASSTGVWAVAAMAFIAVAREGLETALFLWTAIRATGGGFMPLTGAALGLAVAIVLGRLIYSGALRLNLSTFFLWTGAALVVIAAGVLAYGVHDLQEAGILPGLHTLAFDVSHIIPPTSWYGVILKGTINFSPATTVLEAVVWVCYIVPVMWLFLRTARPSKPKTTPTTPSTDQLATATTNTK